MSRQEPVPHDDRPVYSFISCSLQQAPGLTGLSADTIRRAIRSGALVAHYGGERGSKVLLRAVDLDEWVRRMPTERPIERI